MAKLSRVKLNEVSFVGKGDNPGAHIILLKEKPEDAKHVPHQIHKMGKEYSGRLKGKLIKSWMDANVDRLVKGDAMTFDQIVANEEIRDKVWRMIWTLEDSISSIMCDEEVTDKASMIQTTVDEFKAAITPITKGETDMSVELKKKLEEAEAKVAKLEGDNAELVKENATLKASCDDKDKKMEEMKKSAPGSEEDIYKGLPEAVVTKMKADSAEIAVLKENDLHRTYIAKAAAFPLVGTADELAECLKKVAKHDAATAEKLEGIFKTAQTRIAEGDLLKETGKNVVKEEGTGAYAQLQKKAAEYQKEHPELTIEKAFSHVYDTEKELVKQYNEERQGKK